MPTIRDAPGWLEEVRRTGYSNGIPDYQRIRSLIRQYSGAFCVVPSALDSIDNMVAESKNEPPEIRGHVLEHVLGLEREYLNQLFEDVRTMARELAAEGERNLALVDESIGQLTSHPMAPAAKLEEFRGAVHNWFGGKLSEFPSLGQADAERRLIELYIEAARSSE